MEGSACGLLEHPEPLEGLSYLMNEFRRLKVDIVRLLRQKGLAVSRSVVGEYTYFRSSMSNGACHKKVAMGISNQLQPFVVEITD